MSDKETRQEEDKISATVRVRMVVDVTVGSWGASASFASLREQAIREAKQKMNHIIAKADTRDAVVVSAKIGRASCRERVS